MQKKIISNSQVNIFLSQEDYSNAAHALLEQQKKDWQQCGAGYASLDSVRVKEFYFTGFKIKVQFNPGRITSSAAKVDDKSIRERKCFLCHQNLPAEQKGILYGEDYLILCNPFPIFKEHFTLTHINHIQQRIKKSFNKLLSLSKSLSKHYTVFYNGPKCGASAPDHLHFQAGNKFFMPVDNEFHLLRNEFGEILIAQEYLIIAAVDDGLRRFISIESNNRKILNKRFEQIYGMLEGLSDAEEEPMMNILSFYEENFGWRILIFPREKHRPSHFFKEGDEQILLSPASVDLGGVCITPLEKDFEKITKEDIIEIFNEVIINKENFERLKDSIKEMTF